jgi:ubiquinone/menaquinone biosynthesis C-methylase UbiE
MKLDQIRRHWEDAGRQFTSSGVVTPTTRDPFLGELERRNVLEFLNGKGRAIEVGCGDAGHTVQYARRVAHLDGVDFSSTLLGHARRRLEATGCRNVALHHASVLDLDEALPAGVYSRAISQRCLINLPDWSTQKEALRQLHRRLRQGGLLLLTEGFAREWENVDRARTRLGLGPLRRASFNRNFDRREFETFIRRLFRVEETRHYGFYLFATRVLHPLAVRPAEPRHDAPLNRAAMEASDTVPPDSFDAFSYNRFYALRKR